MVFDKPEHKQFILELMQQVQYPGQVLDLAYEIRQAVKNAEVRPQPAPSAS